jgi:hypothetical protein
VVVEFGSNVVVLGSWVVVEVVVVIVVVVVVAFVVLGASVVVVVLGACVVVVVFGSAVVALGSIVSLCSSETLIVWTGGRGWNVGSSPSRSGTAGAVKASCCTCDAALLGEPYFGVEAPGTFCGLSANKF